jgi:hypothetical protein
VVSLQKLFLNSNGAQISDLIKFEGSKCVHDSNLKITSCKVFYKFWGIHRLQICYFWMTRAKDKNYLVLKCYLYHLNFTSKLCTTPLWFLCISVFYTLQGIQGYLVCKFCPSIWFYIDFISCSRNLEIEFEFKNEFWLGWPGGWPSWPTWQNLIGWYRFD